MTLRASVPLLIAVLFAAWPGAADAASSRIECTKLWLAFSQDMEDADVSECWQRTNASGKVQHDIVQYVSGLRMVIVAYSHGIDGAFIAPVPGPESAVRAIFPRVYRTTRRWSRDAPFQTGRGMGAFAFHESDDGICVSGHLPMTPRDSGYVDMLTAVVCLFDGTSPDVAHVRRVLDDQRIRQPGTGGTSQQPAGAVRNEP